MDVKKFLLNIKNRNIPIMIISAGIGNVIDNFLLYNNTSFDELSNVVKVLRK